ncbi:hypothetical protein N431DRAFT_515972 [Stipitochalara longipes BDJ]|nr:hypothetical protein N431DRAFT_515972 [Stipitochalara longipes BDJ]
MCWRPGCGIILAGGWRTGYGGRWPAHIRDWLTGRRICLLWRSYLHDGASIREETCIGKIGRVSETEGLNEKFPNLGTSSPSSNPSTSNYGGSHSTTSPSSSSIEQLALAAYLIDEYLARPEGSEVQHQHASAQQAIYEHTQAISSQLDDFNSIMIQGYK